jgi:hypothetical protein
MDSKNKRIEKALDHLQRGFLKMQRRGTTSLAPMDFARAFLILKNIVHKGKGAE